MPAQATFSIDGTTWLRTGKGSRDGELMIHKLMSESRMEFVVWSPRNTSSDAAKFVREMNVMYPFAKAEALRKSLGERSTPISHSLESERLEACSAPPVAWERGSSERGSTAP